MATYTNTKRIRADLYDGSEIVVRAKQYDKATRYLNIACTDNGETVRIDPAEYEAYAKVLTPNNFNIHSTERIESDGTITVTLTDRMLNTAGICKMDINLYTKSSQSLISTMGIKLIVIASAYDDSREIEADEFSALTDLISEVTFKKNNYDKAEAARVEAENKRVSAENSRVSAEKTRDSNENTRKSNESTRQTSETNRVNSESSRVNAEKARVTAETNRVNEFNTLKTQSETATAGAEKVNIKTTSATDSYTITVTNRNGTSSTSPNLLNKIGIGTVSTLASDKTATASLSGNFGAQKLNLGIPVGKTPNMTIGTVSSGLKSSATITGTPENPVLNLVLQKGLGDDDYMSVADFEALFK